MNTILSILIPLAVIGGFAFFILKGKKKSSSGSGQGPSRSGDDIHSR